MVGTDLEARIRERAYQIWEREGRPQGMHLEHWRRAEQEVKSQAEQGVLGRSVERPNPAPRTHPASATAAQAPGTTQPPGTERPRAAEAATATGAKRAVKKKQTQSEAKAAAKAPRAKRAKTTAPKSTD